LDVSIPFWMYIVGFPLLLGPLVTLHELGHYLVARWFGVEAEAFSVGFGKELAGFTDRRGTRWKLSALPLGGYVQFKGDMNPASVPERGTEASGARDGSFQNAPLWQRAPIVAAGPATNLLVTLAIFAGFFMAVGKPVAVAPERQLTVAAFSQSSPAERAGIAVGDRIVAIDGRALNDFRDLQEAVMLYPGKRLAVTVERDGARATLPVTAAGVEREDRFGNVSRIGLIGVRPAGASFAFERQGPLESLALAGAYSVDIMRMMFTGIGQILSGERSVKELGGPVKIAKFSGEQLSLGPLAFINFVALISLNLAFINLLPIPGLDGGHLAFYAAEAVRRKPVGPRGLELAYRTGMALVLMLMLFVTFNDLASLPIFGG
jgi:regulator of sigma E protease